eukprot:11975-Heterococcus_DN1.PRE.3
MLVVARVHDSRQHNLDHTRLSTGGTSCLADRAAASKEVEQSTEAMNHAQSASPVCTALY